MSSFNPFGKFFKATVPLSAPLASQSAAAAAAAAAAGAAPVAADASAPLADASAASARTLSFGGLTQLTGLSAGLARTSIDVSGVVAAPTIVRGGEEVVAPPLNVTKVTDLIGRLQPIQRVQVPRGVSQSIAPGTMVAKGTPVDVVFVPVSDIDFSLFDNVHDDLKAKSVQQILPLVQDLAVVPILQKAKAADLTDAEKTALTAKMLAAGITVNEQVPTKTFSIAFNSLKSAKAFQ